MQTHTMIHRRGLLTGFGALIAAPAIVRAASLMPVRRPPLTLLEEWGASLQREEILDAFYGIGRFMIYLEYAEDEVIRMTAIPPEKFFKSD